ncbi:hypothetical protein GCM10009839_91960 [Catenulispora yoronensis]|uniref:Uncharacterized protein n=2 Tax=Catenulispora yoronensis TaxID=450799 RepID=A0ABP5HCU9_9ACTN
MIARVLIVGRSPSVLMTAVQLLRDKGFQADVTNQFDSVLDDYDVAELDVVVFGGMVPPETKQYLREEIARRNDRVAVVQGLAGIPGVIAAQVEAVAYRDLPEVGEVTYEEGRRVVRVVLGGEGGAEGDGLSQVSIEALWGTSFTPPEPTSTSEKVFEGELAAGVHEIAVPDQVPDMASFAVVTVGPQVRVFTVGAMPQSVMRMVPTSAEDQRLPGVAAVTTHSDDS